MERAVGLFIKNRANYRAAAVISVGGELMTGVPAKWGEPVGVILSL